jgi:hypothetical protein
MKRLRRDELIDAMHVSAASTYFFIVLGSTVFLNNVLELLARTQPFIEVFQFRRVCKLWYGYVCRVTHANLHGPLHLMASLRNFENVCSLQAHRDILCTTQRSCDSKSIHQRITTLSIKGRNAVAPINGYHFDAAPWQNLTTLIFPDCRSVIASLGQLSNLTELDVRREAFGDDYVAGLFGLKELRELRIRGFPPNMPNIARNMTALQSLNSDMASHFIGYTGRGMLVASDEEGIKSSDDDDDGDEGDDDHDEGEAEEMTLRNTLFPLCLSFEFGGHWKNGAFTGYGVIPYRGYKIFKGMYINGILDGDQCIDGHIGEMLEWHGPYRKGVRHGKFEVYSWTNRYGWPRCNYTLCRTEEWREGVLVSVTPPNIRNIT